MRQGGTGSDLPQQTPIWLAVWAVIGLGLAIAYWPLLDEFGRLAFLLFMLHFFAGLALLAVSIIAALRRHRAHAVVAVAVLAIMLVLFQGGEALAQAGARIVFANREVGYRALLSDIRAGKVETRPIEGGGRIGERDGTVFRIDEGPPMRVAFLWGGVPGNWHGVVYDETAVVPVAGEPPNPAARHLFGGGLARCRHLSDGFHHCSFGPVELASAANESGGPEGSRRSR